MLKKIILMFVIFISFFWGINDSFADKEDYTKSEQEINIDTLDRWNDKVLGANEYFSEMYDGARDKTAWLSWEEWVIALFYNLSKTLKNIFYAIASVYLIILVLMLFFSSNTEEEVSKFKKWIIWVSVWIMLMQIATTFVYVTFDKSIDNTLATQLSDVVIYPFIELIRFMAAFLFIMIAIFSFFTLVTANWDEERIKKWKLSIVQAIIWFFMLKITEILVTNTYGRVKCSTNANQEIWTKTWQENVLNTCLNMPSFDSNGLLIIKTINWINGFVAILTILFIIWAWFIILFSNWDEEKMKKAKWIIVYVILWLVVLVISYLILNFLPWAQNEGLI